MKPTLSLDQAEELETLIGELISRETYPEMFTKALEKLLDNTTTSNAVISGITARAESCAEDVQLLEDECIRDAIDAAADSLKRLDQYLAKSFNVKMVRKTKRGYIWQVWS